MSLFPGIAKHKSKIHSQDKPQIVVEVRIFSERDVNGFALSEVLKGLVDTGTSRTAVCQAALQRIQADEVGVTLVCSYASKNDLQVSTYCLNVCVLREDSTDFEEILGLDVVPFSDGQAYDMLLGMDVLSQFRKIEIEGTDITFHKK